VREEEGGREERGRGGNKNPLSDRSGYGPDFFLRLGVHFTT